MRKKGQGDETHQFPCGRMNLMAAAFEETYGNSQTMISVIKILHMFCFWIQDNSSEKSAQCLCSLLLSCQN